MVPLNITKEHDYNVQRLLVHSINSAVSHCLGCSAFRGYPAVVVECKDVWETVISEHRFFAVHNLRPELWFSMILIVNGVWKMPSENPNKLFLASFIRRFVSSVNDFSHYLSLVDPSNLPQLPSDYKDKELVVRMPSSCDSSSPKIKWTSSYHSGLVHRYCRFKNIFREFLTAYYGMVETTKLHVGLEDPGFFQKVNRHLRNILLHLAVNGVFPYKDAKINLDRPWPNKLPQFPSFVVANGAKLPKFVEDLLPRIDRYAVLPDMKRPAWDERSNQRGRFLCCQFCCKVLLFSTYKEDQKLTMKDRPAVQVNHRLRVLQRAGKASHSSTFIRTDQKPTLALKRSRAWRKMREHIFTKHSDRVGTDADQRTEWGLCKVYTSCTSKLTEYATYPDDD